MDVFTEVSRSVDATLRDWIQKRHLLTGTPHQDLCIDAGKALVMVGCSFIGVAIGVTDPGVALKPGEDCLAKLQELAKRS